MRSTSGGAFYSIAKAFLSKYDNYGACIYGAAWSDPYTVSHIGISEISGLDDLRRSKYIQSSTIHIFEAIKKEIDDRKKVLFSGTPCQIAELYEFLGSRYEEQLLTVDLVCNGVASPIVFKDYIKSLEQKRGNKIVSYSFRNKMPSKNSLKYIEIIYENGKRTFTETDLFYICYQNRLLHRESCFICPYTEFNHLSDITIGDFWHIEEKIESIKDQRPFGISMMLCNTKKGIDCVTELTDIHISEATLDMIDFGEVLNESLRPSKMDEFYMNYKKKKLINELFVYVGFKEILSKRHPYLYSRYRRLRDLINRG
ncbi:Coenzyme F420 hydrogenase/dehydrogenase, beta subunit C-terminal domain [Oribacterium sp. NK2B42]|uniref:Coenzyme F420 hydrogenase/dehydrogenase, beta subunit C-terminal domain n=1 Tax=Oribacterium sp. NK2B42 TaxID=689781 RepID=UPI001FA7C1D5|nr:Coenzyme F420 hydrogenase/dehydrogenase, beta subunit C-terminal domain [Oribacterium sp. NK2B42]